MPWTDPTESPCPNASPGLASERHCPVSSRSRSSHPTPSTLACSPSQRPSQVRRWREKDYGPSAPPPTPPLRSLARLGTPRRMLAL